VVGLVLPPSLLRSELSTNVHHDPRRRQTASTTRRRRATTGRTNKRRTMLPSHNMHQRPAQASRTPSSSSTLSRISSSASRLNLAAVQSVSRFSQSRETLLPTAAAPVDTSVSKQSPGGSSVGSENSAMFLGMPLKYVS
jgi:hypothetical protein